MKEKSIEINGKTYCKIHELTNEIKKTIERDTLKVIEIDTLNLDLSVDEIKELLLGINCLAVDLENEFIYRGDMLRELIDKIHEVYQKNKFNFELKPSKN